MIMKTLCAKWQNVQQSRHKLYLITYEKTIFIVLPIHVSHTRKRVHPLKLLLHVLCTKIKKFNVM